MKSGVSTYLENNDDISLDDIEQHFGTPSEIVSEYIDSIDPAELYKRLSTSRMIKISTMIVVAVVVIIGIIWTALFYSDYLESKEQYIEREVITVEED